MTSKTDQNSLKQQRASDTRNALLAAARQLFGRKGYSQTSLAELVETAGVTTGSLYYHFHDKAGVLAALAELMDQELIEQVREAAASHPDKWQGLMRGIEVFLDRAADPEFRQILGHDAGSVLGAAQWMAIRERNGRGYFRQVLAHLKQHKIINVENVEVASTIILAMLNGAAEATAKDPEAAKKLAIQLMQPLRSGH